MTVRFLKVGSARLSWFCYVSRCVHDFVVRKFYVNNDLFSKRLRYIQTLYLMPLRRVKNTDYLTYFYRGVPTLDFTEPLVGSYLVGIFSLVFNSLLRGVLS